MPPRSAQTWETRKDKQGRAIYDPASAAWRWGQLGNAIREMPAQILPDDAHPYADAKIGTMPDPQQELVKALRERIRQRQGR